MPSRDTPLSTRASRSRFSSPAIAPGASDAAAKANGQNGSGKQTALDAWLEPPMSRDPPLPNMQPLGTMPKAAAFKKFEPTSISRQPKIIFKKSIPASNTARSTPQPPTLSGEVEEVEGDAVSVPPPAHVPQPQPPAISPSPMRSVEEVSAPKPRLADEDIFSASAARVNSPLPSGSQNQPSPSPIPFASASRKSLPGAARMREYSSPQPQQIQQQPHPRIFSQPVHPSFSHQRQTPASPTPVVTPAGVMSQSPSAPVYHPHPRQLSQTPRAMAPHPQAPAPHVLAPHATPYGSIPPPLSQGSLIQQNQRFHLAGQQIHPQQQIHPAYQGSHIDFDDGDDDMDPIDQIVEHAVNEALAHNRYATAYALRTLYDENSAHSRFLNALEDLFRQTGDPEDEDIKWLYMLISDRKRVGARENTGWDFFYGPMDPTNPENMPKPPKEAEYSGMVRHDHSNNKQEALARKGKGKAPSPPPSRAQSPAPAVHNRIIETVEDEAQGQPHKRMKTAHPADPVAPAADIPKMKTPKRANGVNGNAEITPSRHGGARPRGNSEESTSTLSTARSVSLPAEQAQDGSPTKSRRTHKKVAAEAPTGTAPESSDAQDDTMLNTDTPPAFEFQQFPLAHGSLDPEDPKEVRKKAARAMTEKPAAKGLSADRPKVASNLRKDLPVGQPDEDVEMLEASTSLGKKRPSRAVAQRSTRLSAKRGADEISDDVSPTTGNFSAAESNIASRATTPGPKAKKAKTGLRVKNSPMKKKTGPSAGVPRPSGERASPAETGAATRQDDNDDNCASCSGAGELLCCDGCPRALHFLCVDPPMTREPEEEFYCNVCSSSRLDTPPAPERLVGPFGSLIDKLDNRNSSAFRLPRAIQGLFEGVKATSTGEYENIVAPVPKVTGKKKTPAEEREEYFRIRDDNDQPVLCRKCDKPCADDRTILACSSAACGTWWHMECVSDVPVTHPPSLKTWKCPLHVPEVNGFFPGGGAHKLRMIKNAKPIKPAYSRGLVNNGIIEIIDDEDPMPASLRGWYDSASFGHAHQVSAQGVRKDFAERVNKQRRKWRKTTKPFLFLKDTAAENAAPDVAMASSGESASGSKFLDDRRPLDHAQAVQVVTSLGKSSSAPADGVGQLVNAMLQGGSDQYMSLVAQANPMTVENGAPLSASDRAALQAIQARIAHLLSESSAPGAPAVEAVPGTEAGPVSDEETVAADNSNGDLNGDRQGQGNGEAASQKSAVTSDAATVKIESDHVKTEVLDEEMIGLNGQDFN